MMVEVDGLVLTLHCLELYESISLPRTIYDLFKIYGSSCLVFRLVITVVMVKFLDYSKIT